MNKIRTVWDFIRDLLGFKSNSKYVRSYINELNIKSSIYMSFIVIVIELWLIIRQLNTYVFPDNYWNAYEGLSGKFNLIFMNTSLYLLFIMAALSVFVFSIMYLKKKTLNKADAIFNLVLGGLCVIWILFLLLETLKFDNTILTFDSICTILLYSTLPLLGITIILHTIYNLKYKKNNMILGVLVIIFFALVCLLFGFKVGYSDFASLDKKIGDAFTAENIFKRFDRVKMITCFLTMVLFVACVLIWKPYISIIMLSSIFAVFDIMLLKTGLNREFLEGDRINYYTFLISLTVISISIYRQRLAEAQKEQRLIRDAIYDPTIDIHNVAYLTDQIINLEKLNPSITKESIYLFINIANFRTINDQKGFEEGDKFLAEIADNIKRSFEGDLVARQSDDHFVVFTKVYNLESKLDILDSLVKDTAQGLFVLLKVGGYRPQPNELPNKAIDKARYACGIIKRNTEVRYNEYNDKMDENFKKRQYIVNHLDEAIEKGWIRAYYQPVVWSKDHELCGAEALARWIDPTYGFLSPGDFIPVLEETRLIHKLDLCIINCVCKNMRTALDNGRTVVPVSLNFSRLDFELMDVVKELEEATNKYEIDKRYIHVEVTESALSNNVESLNQKISTLKGLGYAIWLDDFGSGYSSLNVLKDFSFDVIKIDMKFLTNFDSNEKTKDILDCIIQLANRLGMNTLTEGVETENESKFLEKIGCGRLQGYLFGKPYTVDDFEKRIDSKELIISDNLL